MTKLLTKLACSSAAVIAAMGVTPAFAAGTDAGSTISNTATINYQVGGVAQTAVQAVNDIIVDRKVNLIVTEVGSAFTSVVPGQTKAVTTFTVQNTSNDTIDIGLAASQLTGGAAPFSAGTDNFNVTGVSMYVDAAGGTAGVYDDGVDTLVTSLDEMTEDEIRTVYIVADVPIGQVNGDVAAVILTATANEDAGTAIANTAGANTAGMDTVLADGQGTDDAATPDGKHSARDAYKVAAPVLTVAKLSRVIEDPINTIASGNSANAKMIPGATVEYCITVANAAGGAAATNVVITDILPAQTTYLGSFGVWEGGSVASSVCSGGTNTGTQATGTVTGNLGSVAASSTETVYFRVTIN
jgi:uncharacterized repeat protein (TIGR01451 family)